MCSLEQLALIVDPRQSEPARIEALSSIVRSLPAEHPYRRLDIADLYDRLLPDYATRLYLKDGRAIRLPIQRPPLTLADIL